MYAKCVQHSTCRYSLNIINFCAVGIRVAHLYSHGGDGVRVGRTLSGEQRLLTIDEISVERGGTCYGRSAHIADWLSTRSVYVYFSRTTGRMCKRWVNEDESASTTEKNEMISYTVTVLFSLQHRCRLYRYDTVKHIPRRWPTDGRAQDRGSTRTIYHTIRGRGLERVSGAGKTTIV